MPTIYAQIAELAHEAKSLGGTASLATLRISGLPAGRPTNYYTWRTAGDDKVRSAHAALDSRVFSWSNPPEHGHPGTEPNCRCWPEPYYGDPAVPDALLAMVPERRVNTDPATLLASIDTLTRPDGSLAASTVVMHDGARIESWLADSAVRSDVRLPTGKIVRVESLDDVQTIYVGEDAAPVLQSRWTATGHVVTRTRRQLAFLMDDPLGPDNYFDPRQNGIEPDPLLDPNPAGSLFGPGGPSGLGIVGAALLLLYLMRQAEPASMGASGQGDFVAFRAWTSAPDADGRPIPVPIAVGSLTEEQARQSCKLLPDVQAWTDQAARDLAMGQAILTAQSYGIRLHSIVKAEVDAKKLSDPFLYRGVSAEYSITSDGKPGTYGAAGTRRLDVIDKIPPEAPRVICDYEIKTGGAAMTRAQLNDYIAFLAADNPGAVIYLFQVKPTYRPPR